MKVWKRRLVRGLCVVGVVALAVGGTAVLRWAGERAALRAEYVLPPEGMVFVPAGDFLMGSDDPTADADEGPLREKFLGAYYIDAHEVTNAEYQLFKPEHTFAAGEADFPVTGILLKQARAYAAWAGKRLPTKAEWEKAARGTDGRLYTWGNSFEQGLANVGGKKSLAAVGSHPESVSPYGAHDMIGNAWEWVDDVHKGPSVFGTETSDQEVIKGGAYSYNAYQARASYNGFEGLGGTCNDVGFRCVLDAEKL